MNIAVTGGTGCLGSPLLRKLQQGGHNVKVLVPEFEEINAVSGNIIRGTINDEAALDNLLEGVDIVFHLAAKVHDRNIEDSADLDKYRKVSKK